MKYRIKGELTYNETETEAGFPTVEIDEEFESEAECCIDALAPFLEAHPEYDYFGSLKTCDAETYGKKRAHFYDQNEEQTIDVESIPGEGY